ncbi:MAG: hypothetical protein OIF56_01830 [Cohaesibacter sp.]|nr:hypothetical protein [Cohaesibacter sp.]
MAWAVFNRLHLMPALLDGIDEPPAKWNQKEAKPASFSLHVCQQSIKRTKNKLRIQKTRQDYLLARLMQNQNRKNIS